MNIGYSKYLYITLSVMVLSAYSLIALAAGFAPGTTLDPVTDFPSDCTGPNDTNCFVQTTEIERGTGAPGSTPAGFDPVAYIDESTGDLYTWDGAAWNKITGGTGGSYVLYGENPVAGYTSPLVTGINASAIGDSSEATGNYGFAAGVIARANGNESIALGSEARASGLRSVAIGRQSQASSAYGVAIGHGARTYADDEYVIGMYNTQYSPANNDTDRVFTVGNGIGAGMGLTSDALTILKNGNTGIGFDNFETTANTELLQVNGDIRAAGGIVQTSDRRLKDNIHEDPYGLDIVNQLKPVAYNLKRDGSAQLGFIAQDIEPLMPELVSHGDYLALNYQGFIPVLAKAIQELDIKIAAIENQAVSITAAGFSIENLKSWFAETTNGIGDFFAHRVRTDELCIGNTCLDEDQVKYILESVGADPVHDVPTDVAPDVPAPDETGSPDTTDHSGDVLESDNVDSPIPDETVPQTTPSDPTV